MTKITASARLPWVSVSLFVLLVVGLPAMDFAAGDPEYSALRVWVNILSVVILLGLIVIPWLGSSWARKLISARKHEETRFVALVNASDGADADLAVVIAGMEGVQFRSQTSSLHVPWGQVRGIQRKLVGDRAVEVLEFEGEKGSQSFLVRPFGRAGMFPAPPERVDRVMHDLQALFTKVKR